MITDGAGDDDIHARANVRRSYIRSVNDPPNTCRIDEQPIGASIPYDFRISSNNTDTGFICGILDRV